MPDLISDERLGQMISKLWSDYVKGLIMWSEFNTEVMSVMLEARGDR